MLHPQEAACDVGATQLGVYNHPLCTVPWETHARRPCPSVKNRRNVCAQVSLAFRAELWVLRAQMSLWGAGCVVQVFSSSGRSWELHGSCCSLPAAPGLGLRVRLCLSAFLAHVLLLIYPICRSHSDGFWVIFRRKCSVCYLTCDTSTERRNFKKSPGSPSWSLSPNVKADFDSQRMLLSKDTDVYHRHNS